VVISTAYSDISISRTDVKGGSRDVVAPSFTAQGSSGTAATSIGELEPRSFDPGFLKGVEHLLARGHAWSGEQHRG